MYNEEDEYPDQRASMMRSNLSTRVHESELYYDDRDQDQEEDMIEINE